MTRRQTAQIVAQLGLVRRLAHVLGGRLHNRGSDDLISAGYLALVRAVLGFDGRRFTRADQGKYLGWKIWCAQLDAVRGRDLMAGTYRAWQRGSLAQKPLLLSIRMGNQVEDDEVRVGGEISEQVLPTPQRDPEALAIAADEARVGRLKLRGLLARLSHRDRLILIARYGHGRRLIAIGREYHVGESRIGHITTQGLRTLRAAAVA